VEIRSVHDFAEHRIEEGLRQFRLLVIGQQADVEQRPLPGDVADRFRPGASCR
jgi:hypothetical protein